MIKKNDVDRYVKQLLKKKISYYDIPEEITETRAFVSAAVENGIMYFARRGYDVIRNIFFVEEYVNDDDRAYKEETRSFETFEEFYDYLKGDIYENSCYYQYEFSREQIKKYGLEIDKLNSDHFIDYTIDDLEIDELADDEYDRIEKKKKQIIKWIDKFLACNTSDDFLAIKEKFYRNKNYEYIDYEIVMDQFVSRADSKAFDILMDLCNRDEILYTEKLAVRFGIQKVIDAYDPQISKQMKYKRKRKLREFAEKLAGDYSIEKYSFFEKETHFYVVTTNYISDENGHILFQDIRYMNSFEEFASFLNNDLSGSDLSAARLDMDLSGYIVDEETIMPIDTRKFKIKISTKVDKRFEVSKKWYDNNGHLIDENDEVFDFFADFAYFLHYDLSGTDFLLCDGIYNLRDISGLILNNCRFKSDFMDKFGMKYTKVMLPKLENYSFAISSGYEIETEAIFQRNNEITLSLDEMHDINKVFYISDLHLMHRFVRCKSEEDVEYEISNIARCLKPNWRYFTLVGGDVSSEFKYYTKLLDYIKDIDRFSQERLNDIFILGNHELWSFPGKNFEEIVDIYREEVQASGCYFLQNSILFKQVDETVHEIDEQTLAEISEQKLREKLKKAHLIILGGLAFSGLNERFNAKNGIYRGVISREREILESKKFESLYRKVCNALYDKNVVIFTHTPKEDWTNDSYMPNFVYVSGHSHNNYFYDDGITRVYADNQIGYRRKDFSLKYFCIDKEYDYFADYEDGIYEISKGEYIDFYRAKNLRMDYNREGTVIMLKREGYYCFFLKGKTRNSMLNGGAIKRAVYPIEYYYDRMLDEIAFIKKPLDKYTAIQEKISEQIIAIGGSGNIHGAIIDIDFLNHIYVNPNDLKITGYFAYDMVNKKVYNNIPSLLKDQCPLLFANYSKMLAKKDDNALMISKDEVIDTRAKYYLDTDIYRASREIKKMQKVNKGILSTWIDSDTGRLLLE